MADKAQIQINFNRAKQQANELESLAKSLENLSGSELENLLEELSNCWKGDNATRYRQKGAALQAEISKTAKSIRNTANGIRSIAQNTYEAEMNAVRIAEERAAAVAHITQVADAVFESLGITSNTGSSGGGHSSGGGGRDAFGGGGGGSRF